MFQKSSRFSAIRGALALVAALLSAGSPPALGHGGHGTGSYDPMDPPEGTIFDGFRCTTNGGVVMQSNLSASCAEWWPGCRRKPDPPPPGKKCPNSCKRAYFIVRHVPIYGADEWIHHQGGYNNYNNNTKYGTYGGDGGTGGTSKLASTTKTATQNGGGKNRPTDADGVPDYSAEAAGDDGPGSTAFAAAPAGKHTQAASRAEAGNTGLSPAAGPGPTAATAAKAAGANTDTNSAGLPASGPSRKGGKAGDAVGGAMAEDGPLTLERAMALAAKANGDARDFSAEAAAADPSSKSNYSDPWMDYIAGTSRAELVNKLEHDAKMRDDLRKRIDDMIDASGASSATVREKVDYYRKALAEAEARLRQGGLQALKPLDVFEEEARLEAFSMNSDETDREIRRLLASMDDSAAKLEDKDEGRHYPLFSRVHRSLWRQLANGNIVLKARKR